MAAAKDGLEFWVCLDSWGQWPSAACFPNVSVYEDSDRPGAGRCHVDYRRGIVVGDGSAARDPDRARELADEFASAVRQTAGR